jgi:uncharacterized FlaG/YvyC family protein
MQVEGNIASTKTTPSATVNKEAATSSANSTAAYQPESTQQQPGQSEASIVSMLKQDGVVVSFGIDKDTKEFVVKVVNPFTNQVIRQIPPEELTSLANSIQQAAGLLIDKQA